MKKLTLTLLVLVFAIHTYADSKVLTAKDKIDQLNSDLITANFAPANMETTEILRMLKEQEELNSYLYQSYLEPSYSAAELEKYYFAQDSWYPQFCQDLIKADEDIAACFKAISSILSPLGEKFGFLYVNGDEDSSDFKTITLVYSVKGENEKLIVTLKVHEERN